MRCRCEFDGRHCRLRVVSDDHLDQPVRDPHVGAHDVVRGPSPDRHPQHEQCFGLGQFHQAHRCSLHRRRKQGGRKRERRTGCSARRGLRVIVLIVSAWKAVIQRIAGLIPVVICTFGHEEKSRGLVSGSQHLPQV